MLFDQLAYWVLLFERFVLLGLCYLCTFSANATEYFLLMLTYVDMLIVKFVCKEDVFSGFLQSGDVFCLSIHFDGSYPVLTLMMFCWVLWVLMCDHILACLQKLLDLVSLILL
ncbi:hypothetical protein Hanom_Chr16g01496581 [Helianthus anomalus]